MKKVAVQNNLSLQRSVEPYLYQGILHHTEPVRYWEEYSLVNMPDVSTQDEVNIQIGEIYLDRKDSTYKMRDLTGKIHTGTRTLNNPDNLDYLDLDNPRFVYLDDPRKVIVDQLIEAGRIAPVDYEARWEAIRKPHDEAYEAAMTAFLDEYQAAQLIAIERIKQHDSLKSEAGQANAMLNERMQSLSIQTAEDAPRSGARLRFWDSSNLSATESPMSASQGPAYNNT